MPSLRRRTNPAPDPTSATPSRRRIALVRSGGLFVLVSALCGLLMAGLALPVLGAASAGAKATEDALADLPVAFDAPAQSQRSTVLDAKGDVLAYFYEENRVYVELDRVAPVMRKAMVAIEDPRFYEHG